MFPPLASARPYGKVSRNGRKTKMSFTIDLAGHRALVTGASSGLGAHFARVLASAGASVIAAGRRADALAKTCAAIREAGGEAEPIVMDVTDARSVTAAFGACGAFDILVNNAGVATHQPFVELSEADWDAVLDPNLKGAFLVARAAAQQMRGRGGAIVNIASILGERVAGQVAAYAASKAGLIQLTRAMALELARDNIRVNALCPGYIETDLNRVFFASEAGQAMRKRIPQQRLGQLADLDGALLLLCSPAGAFITGASLAVDGGHLVSSL
jgi:NAD(P)-dependent dehydrogenase (short-subunit alcohol dehydrogenase family)